MATSNTLLTIGMITNESLPVLENELTFTRLVSRQYDKQFGITGAKIGDTVNIRKPVRYIGSRTPTLNVQGSTESSVALTLSTQYQVAMSFTSADLKLSIDDFSDRFIKPAVAQMANMIDYDGLQLYKNIYNTVGTPGVTPSTIATVLALGVKLDNEAAPMGTRYLCLNPAAQAGIVGANTLTVFNPQKTISDQYLKGSMGTAFGFDFYMDQNIAVHTIGTYAANVVGGAVTVTNATSSGSTIVTGGWTSGDILNIGDVITFGTTTTNGVFAINPQNYQSTGQLRQFVVTAPATADGGGAMTISISPSIIFNTTGTPNPFATIISSSNTIAATAVVGVFGASATSTPQNIAFCKEAFSFATVMLPDMPGVENARATSEKLAMSIRLISAYDVVNDRRISRLDLLGGWVTLRPELACRLAG